MQAGEQRLSIPRIGRYGYDITAKIADEAYEAFMKSAQHYFDALYTASQKTGREKLWCLESAEASAYSAWTQAEIAGYMDTSAIWKEKLKNIKIRRKEVAQECREVRLAKREEKEKLKGVVKNV